jgi:outer membrane autotransporter protein
VNNVIESLTPSLDTGAAMASIDFGGAVNTNASTRLAALRGSALSGVATGDASLQNRFWVKGFGNVTEQDDNKGNRGYDASTAGASFGIDSDAVVDGYTTGVGFSYGNTKVDSNASSNAETDVDSYMASLYGSKVFGDGMFVNGMVNLGYNKYDFERQALGFAGKTKGDTDGLQGGAKVELGRDYAMGSTLFTPVAGLQYTYLKMDEYTEKGPTAQKVDPDALSTVDASLGLQVSHDFALENGATLRPAVRAKYVYRMGDDSLEANSQFVAGGGAFTTQGVEADRSSINLGTGVTLLSAGGLDMGIDYDADIRSNLTGHTGQVKVRWVF